MSRNVVRFALVIASTALALLAGLLVWRTQPHEDETPRITQLPGTSPQVPDPARTFRIYIIGGSTPAGCPFEERSDFGRIVAWLFDGKLRGRTIEVHNYAGSGEDSSYEVKDAEAILALEHDPENAVLFMNSGNNEYVPYDTVHDLAKRERELFDTPLVPPGKPDEILATFEERMSGIVERMQAARIPVILSTTTVNLADWEPERSVLADASHADAMRAHLERGAAHVAAGELDAARTELAAAHALEPHFAWASFQLGQVLRRLKRFDEARVALQAAVDDNAAPNAASSKMNAFMRELARKKGLPLVDAETLVRDAAPDGIPGFESFWDNCHPTLATFLLVSQGFADELARLSGESVRRTQPKVEELARALSIDDDFMARVLHQRGQYFYTASALIWNPTQRLAKSGEYLALAARARPNDATIVCSQAVLDLFRDDPASSLAHWRRAQTLDAAEVKKRLKHKFVRGLLARNGIDDGPAWVAAQ